MDAKTKMLEYAAKHNNGKTYTNEQWCGKLITEGCRINLQDAGVTVARATREGKTIIITETQTINGYPTNKVTTTEVMRINL